MGNKFPSASSFYLHMLQDYYLTKAASGMFGQDSEEVIDLITMTHESARNKFGKLDPGILLFSIDPFITKEGLKGFHPLDTFISNNSTAYELMDDVVEMLGNFKSGDEFMKKS